MGLEPTTSTLRVRRATHCAMLPLDSNVEKPRGLTDKSFFGIDFSTKVKDGHVREKQIMIHV